MYIGGYNCWIRTLLERMATVGAYQARLRGLLVFYSDLLADLYL